MRRPARTARIRRLTRIGGTLLLAGLAAASAARVPAAHAQGGAASAPESAARSLTEREREVLERVYAGHCDEVQDELAALRRERDSARLAFVDGTCRIGLRDYAGALPALDEAKRLDAGLADVDVYRGIALYRLEDYPAAREAFQQAAGRTSAKAAAQREFYVGMLLLQEREDRAAAQALERARAMDAAQVEPVASFYAGLAWQAAGERARARESLERVVAADPEGPWGVRAAELLDARSFDERTWASLQAGLEYDSNVVLLGDAVPTPLGISDQADGRAVWFLEGGVELFRSHRWSGGVGATYAGNAQFELSDFDIQYPRGTAWLDFDVDPDNLLRLRYGGGHAWVDYESFLFAQDATLSWFHNWGSAGNTELGLGWLWNDYTFYILPVPNGTGPPGSACAAGLGIFPCAPPGVNSQAARNRDGNSLRPFVLHRYRVRSLDSDALRDVELRAGYAFERYWAEGTDWDYRGHDFLVGAEALLFFGLELDSQLGFSYRPFTNPSSYPNPPTPANVVYALSPVPREDLVTLIGVSLEKPLDAHWSVATRYLFTRSDSTVVVFDYTRHVVGAYVKYQF